MHASKKYVLVYLFGVHVYNFTPMSACEIDNQTDGKINKINAPSLII